MVDNGSGGKDNKDRLVGSLILFIVTLLFLLVLALSGCGNGQAGQDNTSAPPPKPAPVVNPGQIIFQTNCAVCHDIKGKGDGEAAKALPKKPRDLTLPEIQNLPDNVLSQKIRNGVPANGMPAWKNFNDKEMTDLIAYIKTLK